MKTGYARVSTREQNINMQVIALEDDKCDKICVSENVIIIKTPIKKFKLNYQGIINK